MAKLFIGDAIIQLYEQYKIAKALDFVKKPISYALYQTWKLYDKIEKSR